MFAIPKVALEEDQQLEVGLQKVNTIVQELWIKITYLEAWVVPTTPLEEIEHRQTEL